MFFISSVITVVALIVTLDYFNSLSRGLGYYTGHFTNHSFHHTC